ncbi:unnamed protein product [Oncorhynchus mykiss]|uniref:RRM domain-containing protein n=1 Tax=Oncorhynchus mykiss TaxID=8022 RepID=A0A060WIB0_ONCMY|nr:unnamed protein product [Oncorhynchus mykiss]
MIDMPVDRLHPQLLKGYTYMEFEMVVEAEKGLKHMDGGQIDGQEIIAPAPLTGCLHNVATHPIPHKEKNEWQLTMYPLKCEDKDHLSVPWQISLLTFCLQPPLCLLRSRSPRRRSPVRRRTRLRSPGCRRHSSRASSNSSR